MAAMRAALFSAAVWLAGAGAAAAQQPVIVELYTSQGCGSCVEAEVWLIRYDPRGREVEVRRGENRGKTITYRNVVRELVRLGEWNGRPVSFRTPEAQGEGLETLILVQERGGPVLASLAE